MEWQPIETAPKTTDVLVLVEGEVYQGFLVWSGWSFPFADYHGCGCCAGKNDYPTHWMPLPPPPKQE